MKNKTSRKQMSNQIHYDYCPYVSPMTTVGMKSMSPSKQMTHNHINIKSKRGIAGSASLSPATRFCMSVGDNIPSLCINPSYIYRLLNSSFFIPPIYNKCILPSYTGNENIFTFGYAGKVSGRFINYMTGIVYAEPFIQKCFNPANPSQNTHINKPKSARNKPFSENLSKPISKKTTESYGQKTDSFVKSLFVCKNSLSTEEIRKILNEWIGREYQPMHFLSLQLPENKKSADSTTSIWHLKDIMKAFEKSLMNNWNRHHLRFIAFAENGTSNDWHFHILFNQGKFTKQELQNAVLAATIRENLPFYCLELDKIDENMLRVNSYCTKEIKIYWDGKFDSDRIIFSECLFVL